MYPHDQADPLHARTIELAREPHALHIQFHVPAKLPPFAESLSSRLRTVGYSEKDIVAVQLALQEAVNNAFRHGNGSDPSKCIFVRYLLTATEVLLEVEDQGHGFDPKPCLAGPGGRGLFLIRTYMTWVSFNQQGNRVTFCRQRSPS
jgi:serine/threonine-protein kinase RsbW/non-specific serine/threonine protein kinase